MEAQAMRQRKTALSTCLFYAFYGTFSASLDSATLTDYPKAAGDILISSSYYLQETNLTFSHLETELNAFACQRLLPGDQAPVRACVMSLNQGLQAFDAQLFLLPTAQLASASGFFESIVKDLGQITVVKIGYAELQKFQSADTAVRKAQYLKYFSFWQNVESLPVDTEALPYVQNFYTEENKKGRSKNLAEFIARMIQAHLEFGDDPHQYVLPKKVWEAKFLEAQNLESAPGTFRSRRGHVRGERVFNNFSPTFYVRIESLLLPTVAHDLFEVLEEITDPNQGLSNLILDLRDNVGGELGNVAKVANFFTPSHSLILRQKFFESRRKANDIFTTEGLDHAPQIPIVVLINERTGSAAEALAAVLKLHANALIVGNESFGKGNFQEIRRQNYGYLNGDYLKFSTTGLYEVVGPAGDRLKEVEDRNLLDQNFSFYSLQAQGLQPDVVRFALAHQRVESAAAFRERDLIAFKAPSAPALPQSDSPVLRIVKACMEKRRDESRQNMESFLASDTTRDFVVQSALTAFGCLPSYANTF